MEGRGGVHELMECDSFWCGGLYRGNWWRFWDFGGSDVTDENIQFLLKGFITGLHFRDSLLKSRDTFIVHVEQGCSLEKFISDDDGGGIFGRKIHGGCGV